MLRKGVFVAAVLASGLTVAFGVRVVSTRRDPERQAGVPSPRADRTDDEIAHNPALDEEHPKPGPYPPLLDFPVVPAAGAGSLVRDTDFVVGVEINGEARAYPINMLAQPERHILNDTLGSRPIAVTWCGVCQAAIVYLRQTEGRTLRLIVGGDMYLENMIMKDVETSSSWPQLIGQASDGPLSGKTLERVASVWTDWKSWRSAHPGTTVLALRPSVDHYRHQRGRELSARDWDYLTSLQWGLVRGGESLSWPLEELARQSVVNDELEGLPIVVLFRADTWTISAFGRWVGERLLTFRRGASGVVDDQTGSTWDQVTGRAVSGKLAGTRLSPVCGAVTRVGAWYVFHPETTPRMAGHG